MNVFKMMIKGMDLLDWTLASASVFVFCAKKVAELAPGVGQATSMRIVTHQGTFQVDDKTLAAMDPAYEEQANPKLSSVENVVGSLPFEKDGSDDASKK